MPHPVPAGHTAGLCYHWDVLSCGVHAAWLPGQSMGLTPPGLESLQAGGALPEGLFAGDASAGPTSNGRLKYNELSLCILWDRGFSCSIGCISQMVLRWLIDTATCARGDCTLLSSLSACSPCKEIIHTFKLGAHSPPRTQNVICNIRSCSCLKVSLSAVLSLSATCLTSASWMRIHAPAL